MAGSECFVGRRVEGGVCVHVRLIAEAHAPKDCWLASPVFAQILVSWKNFGSLETFLGITRATPGLLEFSACFLELLLVSLVSQHVSRSSGTTPGLLEQRLAS